MGNSQSVGPLKSENVVVKKVHPQCTLIEDNSTGKNYFLYNYCYKQESEFQKEQNQWRNRPSSKYFPNVLHSELVDNDSCRGNIRGRLLTEPMVTRLKEYTRIPDKDALVVVSEAIKGFIELKKWRLLDFKITDQLIGFDKQAVKVWLHPDLSRGDPPAQQKREPSQQMALREILLAVLEHSKAPAVGELLESTAGAKRLADALPVVQSRIAGYR